MINAWITILRSYNKPTLLIQRPIKRITCRGHKMWQHLSPSRIRVRVFSLGCNLHRDDENAPFCHFWSDFFQIFGQLDDCHEELYLPVKLLWSYSKQWLQKRENKYNRVAARQQFTISSKLRRRPWPCRRAPRPYYLFKMRAQLHCSISETAVQHRQQVGGKNLKDDH